MTPKALPSVPLMMSSAVHQPVAFGHTATARAVHANGMNLVEIGQRAKFFCKIAERLDRAEIAIHGIDRFEGDQLGRGGIIRLQQLPQMIDIVVTEHTLLPTVAADTLDHRGVVQFVGIDDETRKQPRQRRERCVIGDVGRGEDQRRLLAMQIGQLGLQRLVIDRGARDVARAPGPCARGLQRLVHRLEHDRMLAHPEVVVAAPDGDVLLRAVGLFPDGVRELALLALDIDECAVAALVMQTVDGCVERVVVVHWLSPFPRPRAFSPLTARQDAGVSGSVPRARRPRNPLLVPVLRT
jgi:hypothetical protein